MVSFGNWEHVKELIVPAFFHIHVVKTHKVDFIPEIMLIIAEYCAPPSDIWDKNPSSKVIVIDEKCPSILNFTETENKNYHSVYGTRVAKKGNFYLWKLRLLAGDEIQACISPLSSSTSTGDYAFDTFDGRIYNNYSWNDYRPIMKWEENDILNVEFDMRCENDANHATLKFYLNDECSEDIPIAFKAIPSEQEYRFSVYLHKTTKLQMV